MGEGHERPDRIAVIGIACRFPGAGHPRAFHRLLRDGRDAVTEVPEGRWDGLAEPHLGPAPARGGFLESVDRFDPGFFGISPREAVATDPQQRLMLELGWEVFEDAGLDPTSLRGSRTAVFAGAIWDDYATLLNSLGDEARTQHSVTGLHRSMIANRLSYFLGLRGPSMTVDCGQSSSLVSVHLAVQALRRGECEVAVAGGVNLNLAPESTVAEARFGGLSPDGRCYTFDARANGFVRGEGGGVVALKPLAGAEADGDPVYCVIEGSAMNNDGGGPGLTAPDDEAQQEVLRMAYADAGIAAADVSYVELHGSGTPVGDPVEAAALGSVLGRERDAPLPVGSVKTNLGHLEGAGGIAGLIKAALGTASGELVPSLHFDTPNPRIPLAELGLRVQREWEPIPDGPMISGVSSFGMGGTNCHVVLSGRAARESGSGTGGSAVLPWVLSGHSRAALRGQARALRSFAEDVGADVAEVGWSLVTGRASLNRRAVLVGSALDDFRTGLTALDSGDPAAGLVQGSADLSGRTVLVFPGQGAQWAGMARDLAASSNVFADRLAECAAALAEFVDWSPHEVLRDPDGALLERVDVVQPALFAVMVSLAELWRAHGVVPDAVVGHSQGEIAAAVVAGGLSLRDGARIVCLRSRMLTELSGHGGMLAVALPAAETERMLTDVAGQVSLAAVNSPSSVVVSGEPAALAEVERRCEDREVRARRVRVEYASHGPQVERIRTRLLEELAPVTARPTEIAFYSSVSGARMDTAELDADYWYENLRRTVHFQDAVTAAMRDGHRFFVESSPHPMLALSIDETAEATGDTVLSVGSLRRDEGGPHRFLHSLAQVHVRGLDVDWSASFPAPRPPKLRLPTYAFQRTRHWPSIPRDRSGRAGSPEHARVAEPDAEPVVAREAGDPASLVRAETAAVLGHPGPAEVDPARPFKELGLDSPLAVELAKRLAAATELPLPTVALFDHPTPAELAEHLTTRLAAEGNGSAGATGTPVTGAPQPEAEQPEETGDDPIAIVAMSCRLPGGVSTPEQLWELLRDGGDGISEFPTDRGWNLDELFAPYPGRPGTSYTSEGGFLHDAAEFDPSLFGLGEREALAMDPQQRLLLETAWETWERAGIDPSSVRDGQGGVFVGMMPQDYGPRLHDSPQRTLGYSLTGTTSSVASGRIAYTFGLRGPALTVDTACSSSLVALHSAVQAMRRGECDFALVGGAAVLAGPGMFVEFSRQRGLSRDGRCKPFSAAADGTGWSEGVAMVLLRRLSDARRDGDRVLGLVRGAAVNSDGASNGLTAPSGRAQQQVIRRALDDAGWAPGDVDAVEAHGTGTVLGDPIEANALIATYGSDRGPEAPLRVGSVKSSIGHTQATAGLAGLIKMLLAARHERLPGMLGVGEPTRHVDWSAGTVRVLTEDEPWPGTDRPRRFGVSSFGISGTNAHVLVEAPPPDPPDERESAACQPVRRVRWPLSARSDAALRAQAARLLSHVDRNPGLRPVDIGYALATTRTVFEHRALISGSTREELLRGLSAVAEGREDPAVAFDEVIDDPAAAFAGTGARRVDLPTYPFQRERYWLAQN